MVLRHQACIVPLVLLALGLSPSAGRVLPRFARGSSSGRLGQAPERASGGSASRRTALRLGEGGHSCLVTDGDSTRRGAWGLPVARGLRGGAIAGADSSEDEEDHSLDDDDFDDEEDMTEEEDFGEANFVDRFKQDWRKTPIITKTFFQVSIGIALAAFFLNGNQWPNFLLLDWQPAIFKLQLWRLFTPFLYLGPVGMNFALTVHFAWTYMSQLEKLHYREPHTFVMLLAFGMSSLLLLTLVTGADVNSSFTLGHSLSCFLVMVWSRKFAGTRVNVLDMFELSTELLPYFFVLQTLMMEGVVPWVDLSGLLIGYAWETLSMKGLLKAPKPLVNLFRKNAFLRAEYAKAGKEYGQELPLHDDDDDDDEDEDEAPVQSPTPDEKSETAVEGSSEEEEEEEEEGEEGGGEPVEAERETKGGGAREASREAATGEGGWGGVNPAEAEPSSEEDADAAEEDAYSSEECEDEEEEEEEEEESGSVGGDEAEESQAGDEENGEVAEAAEQGEEKDSLSEESDELEDFDGESDESDLDVDVEELSGSGSFEDSEEDEEESDSYDF